MPTCRHHMYIMFCCRQYRRGSNHADMPTCRQYPMVWGGGGGGVGGWRVIYTYILTCRHADNDRIVHLIFSNKKIGIVI